MTLHVADHHPAAWFLLRDSENPPPDGDYYLDVNCDRGAVGFSVLVKLSEAEREEYRALGRVFIEYLAARISHWADHYRDRNLSASLGNEVTEAVRRFRNR
ncbi:MAG TPA: hypothetical protein VF541_16520 [Longimicrobium sp.]|jgi:hypothetical protein